MTDAPFPAAVRMAKLSTAAREAFAKHVIVSKHPGRWMIKAHGTSMFWVEIVVLRGGHLLVHGDIDHVLFGNYHPTTDAPEDVVRWMGMKSGPVAYVREKAAIGMGDGYRLVMEYDAKQMRYEIERVREKRLDELRDARAAECLDDNPADECPPDEPPCGECEERFRDDAVVGACEDALECDLDAGPDAARTILSDALDGEDIPDGLVVSSRLVYAHAALKRLVQLLDEEAANTVTFTGEGPVTMEFGQHLVIDATLAPGEFQCPPETKS